jgi:hypothetical protein
MIWGRLSLYQKWVPEIFLALHINKQAIVWEKQKSGRKPQMGAWHQERLADWSSVVTSLTHSLTHSLTEFSWKGAAIQSGLEHRSRGVAIVGSRYQENTSEDCNRLRTLVCVL